MATTAVVQTRQISRTAGLTRIGIGVAMGVLSAVLLIFAFQPYSIWPLAFVAIVPMEIAGQRIMPRKWSGVPSAIGMGGWLAGISNRPVWPEPAALVLPRHRTVGGFNELIKRTRSTPVSRADRLPLVRAPGSFQLGWG